MRLRSTGVSGAADRDQPCGLAVMVDGGQALFAFWVFGQEPMNRRRGRGVSGVFGGGPSIFPEAGHK